MKAARDTEHKSLQQQYLERFTQDINDDLNTPKALATLWDMLKDELLSKKDKYDLALKFDEIFGLDLKKIKKEKISQEIIVLAEERLQARKNKDWKRSDELRDKIAGLGYVIGDTKDGYELKKK